MGTLSLSPTKTTPPKSAASDHAAILQRKCACGGTPGPTGECPECRKKRLQRKARNSELGTRNDREVPPIVHELLRSPGQPLDIETRAFFEQRFGHDFSEVRVHTDARAAESAEAVDALAYTVGRHIAFGSGQYAPGSSAARRLLAHELTHVVQQSQSAPGSNWRLKLSGASAREELEANETADSIFGGRWNSPRVTASATAGLLQRAC